MGTGVFMQQQHPFSEEAWSLPANGGTKFRQDRAVGGRHNGVDMLLEFGEQYALAKPEHRKHDVPGRWCHLKRLWLGTRDVSTAWRYASSRAHNGAPKIHHQ